MLLAKGGVTYIPQTNMLLANSGLPTLEQMILDNSGLPTLENMLLDKSDLPALREHASEP